MTALAAIMTREAKIRATNLLFIFWDLVYPLGYLLVFGVGVNASLGFTTGHAGIGYNAFFLAGVLSMASFGIAANTSWSFFLDRDNGIFYEMLTYPMSRSQYLLGKVLFNVFIGALQSAITVVLAAIVLGVPLRPAGWPLLAAAATVGTAGWFFFYAIFALRIRRNDAFNTVTSVFYFVFLFASSMFYPSTRCRGASAWSRTPTRSPGRWTCCATRRSAWEMRGRSPGNRRRSSSSRWWRSCWRSWRCGVRNDSAALGQPRRRVEREREAADLLVAIGQDDLELHLVPLDTAAQTHRPARRWIWSGRPGTLRLKRAGCGEPAVAIGVDRAVHRALAAVELDGGARGRHGHRDVRPAPRPRLHGVDAARFGAAHRRAAAGREHRDQQSRDRMPAIDWEH